VNLVYPIKPVFMDLWAHVLMFSVFYVALFPGKIWQQN
jgi:hypothetical protein